MLFNECTLIKGRLLLSGNASSVTRFWPRAWPHGAWISPGSTRPPFENNSSDWLGTPTASYYRVSRRQLVGLADWPRSSSSRCMRKISIACLPREALTAECMLFRDGGDTVRGFSLNSTPLRWEQVPSSNICNRSSNPLSAYVSHRISAAANGVVVFR